MIAELSLLITLQETDLEIKRCRAEVSGLPTRREETEGNFAASVKEFLDLKAEYEDAVAEKARLEAEVAEENAKNEKFKADLMKATNEKQYATAVREIDVTKKTISTLETDLLKAMEKVEKLSAVVAERSPEIEVKRQEVDKILAEITEAATAAESKLAGLLETRASLISKLLPQTRSTYERVAKLKSGVVLAEAKSYSCSACRMTIRPQAFNDIRRGDKIYECESCGRILYYRAESASV